jgi:hypothetical protein
MKKEGMKLKLIAVDCLKIRQMLFYQSRDHVTLNPQGSEKYGTFLRMLPSIHNSPVVH